MKTGFCGISIAASIRTNISTGISLAVFALALGMAVSASAQSQSTVGLIPHGMAGLPGRAAPGRAAAESPSGSKKPAWSINWHSTVDAILGAHSAVYDQATATMIVFGGLGPFLESGFTDTNAVLLLAPANGNGTWSTLIANGTAGSPPARDSHSAVYDSANNRMIVFGGESSATGGLLNDVWVLSNANGQGGAAVWIQLSPSGTPPAARCLHTAVYDATNNVMTVFGGGNGPQGFSDVWVLSHANGLGGTPAWTQLSPNGTPPAGVLGSSAVYDPNNNIMTVFGGADTAVTASTNGVWTLSHANGVGGTPQWTNIVANGAAGAPSKRESQTGVYDAASNRMIIFGGFQLPSQRGFNDVWVLANANGLGGTPAWTRLKPTGGVAGIPDTHYFHTAVYDAVNNQMIAFSGNGIDALHYFAWVLSHANGL